MEAYESKATEETRHVYRPVWRSFLLYIVFAWLVIPFVMLLWKRYSSQLIVLPKRVILKKGLLSRTTTEISTGNITGLEVKQTIWQRLLCYGSIYIGTSATEGYEIAFHGLAHPDSVADIIRGFEA